MITYHMSTKQAVSRSNFKLLQI